MRAQHRSAACCWVMPGARPSSEARYRTNAVAPDIRSRLASATSARRWVGVGSGSEDLADRCYPGGDPDDMRPGAAPSAVGLGLDRLDRRAVAQRDRLVVADDRPLIGQFEQGRLAAAELKTVRG